MQKLDGRHPTCKADLTPHEQEMIRLWIDAGANFAGTYYNPLYEKTWSDRMRLCGITIVTGPDGKIDPYATDRGYWNERWWLPINGAPAQKAGP